MVSTQVRHEFYLFWPIAFLILKRVYPVRVGINSRAVTNLPDASQALLVLLQYSTLFSF